MLRKGTGMSRSMKPARTLLHLVNPLVDFDLCSYPLASPLCSGCNPETAHEGLSSVTGIADDTFVFGSTENEQFKCKEVHFFGHPWTPQGVRADNGKVSAIQNMQPPEDIKSLQSFLGLVNYLTRYSAHLATITSPLHELTKKEVAYVCGPEHNHAFAAVK